ncbi:MAG TPA: sulfite exporter TauE/SafE family protein [Bacillales bacterium]|nr:sulfite exporter TauE/SafE family protein [Bacillales bacterium]
MTFDYVEILAGLLVALVIGFSKTGMPSFGIFGVAVMALVFPAKASVGILLPILLTGDLFAITYYRRKVIWKYLWGLIPWVIPGLAAGYFVLEWSNNRGLEILIGSIVLALIGVHVLLTRVNERLENQVTGSSWFSAAIGIMAGFTTMIGNAAGGIMTIYLLSKKLDKNAFIGTGAWFFFFVNLSKVPLYASLGMITWHTLLFNLWMVPAVVVGAFIGIKVLKKIPETWFKWLILVLAAGGAVRLLIG